MLDNVFAEENRDGINLRPGSSSTQVNALIRGSRIAGNHQNGPLALGAGVTADGGVHVWLTGNSIFGNDIGVQTLGTNGGTGVIDSFCDNQVGGNAENGAFTNETCPQAPAPPPQVITNTVTVKQCVVPSLKGLQVSFAKKLLSAANCRLGTVTKKKTTKRTQVGKVISQKTKARKTLAQGTKIGVTVGKR